jgi:hypothetical protein
VNASWIVAAALLATGNTASAQEVASPDAVPVTRTVMRLPLAVRFPILAQAAEPSPQAPASREDIRAMEALLTNALQKGAQDLALRMQVNDPGSRFVTGTGRARGFALDGYGVFFDVDVPGMKQSLVWSSELLRQMQQADYLRQFIASNPDSSARQFAMTELGRLERQLNGLRTSQQPQALAPVPAIPADRTATAQAVNESTSVAAPPLALAGNRSITAAAAPAANVPSDLRDPNELYTDAVKNALIDAMLKYSSFLKIGAEEWLTVAARDSEGPSMPGQIDDASTIVIRIKGSDLAAFQANKLTREEVLKKVQVKEF